MFNIKYILPYLLIVTLIFACDKTPQSVSPEANESPTISQQKSASNNASNKSYDLVVGPNESIQTAVNQANAGDKILVDGGTHAEQILINKDLTLVGQNGATITQPQSVQSYELVESGSSWRPLIFANGGTIQDGTASGSQTVDVSVRGFIIDGDQAESGLTGVLFRNVQSSGGIADVTVKNMDLEDRGSTFGLIAYGDSKVTFANNEITGIERGGIGANGDGGAHPSPDVIVKDNIIVGSENPDNAPNGIQIGYGATGKVSGNTISQTHYTGPVWSASGILIFESDNVKIQDNTVNNADRAIAVSSWGYFANTASGNSITRNTISDSDGGIVVQSKIWSFSTMNSTANNNKIAGNTVEGTGSGIGIHVYADYAEDLSGSYDAVVENNKVINNVIDNFSTAIETDGSGNNKVQANNHPFSP